MSEPFGCPIPGACACPSASPLPVQVEEVARSPARETFLYYLAEAENGWCKIPRRVAADLAESHEALQASLSKAEEEIGRLREALTPGADTKAAYFGDFHMCVTLRIRGQEDYRRVQIPWTSIKEIMSAISARAALERKP